MAGYGSARTIQVMTTSPSAAISAELAGLLVSDDRQLGAVYREVQAGQSSNVTIAENGAAASSNAVGNLRAVITALTQGKVPTSSSLARQAAASIGRFLSEDLSDETRAYLVELRDQLRSYVASAKAQAEDLEEAVQEAPRLKEFLDTAHGVYVYTFPHYMLHKDDADTGRMRVKIGHTSKGVWRRVVDQVRQAGMPEDPVILRVYRSETLTPQQAEQRIHRFLDSIGVERSSSTNVQGGKEWFSTSLLMLDALATAIGLEVSDTGRYEK